MTEQNQIILTWQGNSLFMGKVCVGSVDKMYENSWAWNFPHKYTENYQGIGDVFELDCFFKPSESEARLALESFIRSEMKTQS